MSVGSVQEKTCLRSNWEVWPGTSSPEGQVVAEKEPSDNGQSCKGSPSEADQGYLGLLGFSEPSELR